MTALDFGPVVLGGSGFGRRSDRDESFGVLDAFVAGGGRAIDTADVYSAWVPGHSGGESESIIGDWLVRSGRRDQVLIATKIGMLEGSDDLSAATIARAVDASLRRLRTDRVDLCFAHRDDPAAPQEETMAAFDGLVQAGKVREIGASNFAPDRLRSAAAVAAAAGSTPFTVAQDEWSLVERDAERLLVPVLEELDMVSVPYTSLASGFLTGKYRPGTPVESQRAAAYLRDPRNVDLLEVLDAAAADHDTSVTAISLAWLAAQRTVAAPIASARVADQVPELLAAGRVRLTPQDLEQLSAATEGAGA